MSFSHLEKLTGLVREHKKVAEPPEIDIAAEILIDAEEPEEYRPYILRPRAQMAFAVIEKDGTLHGFMYHQLRHPKHETRGGQEFLSFTADGAAVVMQGPGLRVIAYGLLRCAVFEVREHDGMQPTSHTTRIDRLEVIDMQERRLHPVPQLVKQPG